MNGWIRTRHHDRWRRRHGHRALRRSRGSRRRSVGRRAARSRQRRVDRLKIVRRQRAVGLSQFQVAQQHVVARLREVALGLIELALRIQHVDVDAHAHLVTQPVRIERALARRLRRFQRLDLARARHQPQVGRARCLRHAAAGRFELLLRLLLERQRFLDAVFGCEPGEQRQVEHHADGRCVDARADRAGARAARVARHVVAEVGVERRLVTGFGLLYFETRDIEPEPCLANGRVHVFGLQDPCVDVGRQRRRQHDRRSQRRRRAARSPDQLVEHDLLHLQVVLGSDLLRDDQVVAGLRFARVGDGRGADFEVALGRCELLGDGHLLRPHQRQAVLAGQHVEIRLAHAHDQVLIGGGEHGLRDIGLPQALFVGGPVGRPVDRLRCVDANVLRVVVASHRALRAGQHVDAEIGAACPCRQPHRRQDAGLGLCRARQAGVVLRTCTLVGCVVAACGVEKLDQALAVCRRYDRGKERCERGRKWEKPGPEGH